MLLINLSIFQSFNLKFQISNFKSFPNSSILQSFNLSIFQSFNLSILQSFNPSTNLYVFNCQFFKSILNGNLLTRSNKARYSE
ncbi:MAG: hypothetical protein CFE24_09430 [Flavobacterium sp. BFFFF2]|nr:MAG: hypothetical protein CFE24_09430 [Flavobacterium sp. BFFFF2]